MTRCQKQDFIAYMSLYIDQYEVHHPSKLVANQKAYQELKALAHSTQVPHLIIQGPPGSGKLTMAHLYLWARFQDQVWEQHHSSYDLKDMYRELKNISYPLRVIISPVHYLINLSIFESGDRDIITSWVKELVQYPDARRSIPFRTLIIQGASSLSHEAQEALRRTLEQYVLNTRFIFLANHDTQLIPAINSRARIIRLQAPSYDQLQSLAQQIHPEADPETLLKICRAGPRDFKKALGHLQLVATLRPSWLEGVKVPSSMDWLDQYRSIIDKELVTILQGKDPGQDLLVARRLIYSLLIDCVSNHEIFRLLYDQVIARVLSFCQLKKLPVSQYLMIIAQVAEQYDNAIRLSRQPIYHLEAFMAQILVTLKEMLAHGNVIPYGPLR